MHTWYLSMVNIKQTTFLISEILISIIDFFFLGGGSFSVYIFEGDADVISGEFPQYMISISKLGIFKFDFSTKVTCWFFLNNEGNCKNLTIFKRNKLRYYYYRSEKTLN